MLPVRWKKISVGNSKFPLEIFGHQIDDALVMRVFVIGLQAVQHDHIGPEVELALGAGDGRLCPFTARAEEAIRPLALDRSFDPQFGFVNLFLVAEQIGTVTKALQPVGNFFPTAFAFSRWAKPSVIVFFQEGADLHEMAMEAGGLEFELFAQPTAWLNRP